MDYSFLLPLTKSVYENEHYTLTAIYDSYKEFMKLAIREKIVEITTSSSNLSICVFMNKSHGEHNRLLTLTFIQGLKNFVYLPDHLSASQQGDEIAYGYIRALTEALNDVGKPIHRHPFKTLHLKDTYVGFITKPLTLTKFGQNLNGNPDSVKTKQISFLRPSINGVHLSQKQLNALKVLETNGLTSLHVSPYEKASEKAGIEKNENGWYELYNESNRSGVIKELVNFHKMSLKTVLKKKVFGKNKWKEGIPVASSLPLSFLPLIATQEIGLVGLPVIVSFCLLAGYLPFRLANDVGDTQVELNTTGKLYLEQHRAWVNFQNDTGNVIGYLEGVKEKHNGRKKPSQEDDDNDWMKKLW